MTDRIRPLLATTTEAERREALGEQLKNADEPEDKALLLAVLGYLDQAEAIEFQSTHGPFAATAIALQGSATDVIRFAERQEDACYRNACLLLACDAFLDEGRIRDARAVYKKVDLRTSASYLIGPSIHSSREFFFGGGSTIGFSLHAYVAGRWNDEEAYEQIIEAVITNHAVNRFAEKVEEAKRDLRIAFLRGVVRDL